MPSINKNTGILYSVGTYNQYTAWALGLEHKEGDIAYKGVMSGSGSELSLGLGGSLAW